MKITADVDRCVGAGQCVLTEPRLFDQNPDDGTVVILDHQPPADLTEAAYEAAQLCPSRALSVTNEPP
jgi:ferredoxin